MEATLETCARETFCLFQLPRFQKWMDAAALARSVRQRLSRRWAVDQQVTRTVLVFNVLDGHVSLQRC